MEPLDKDTWGSGPFVLILEVILSASQRLVVDSRAVGRKHVVCFSIQTYGKTNHTLPTNGKWIAVPFLEAVF